MLGTLEKILSRLVLALSLLALMAAAALAQDGSRALVPNGSVGGTLSASTMAQVYTYTGTAGETITVTVTNDAGMALTVLLTDSQGNSVAQAADATATGTAALTSSLTQDGTYYVTVFPAPGTTAPVEGAFEIALQSSGAATIVPTLVPSQPVGFTPPGQILTTSGLQVTLTWASTADMNLQVRDPLGNTLYWDSRTTDNGGSFGFDANGLCQVLTNNPTETASWSAGAIPTGSYEILVFYRQACENSDAVNFTVNVVVDGVALAPIQGTLTPPTGNADSVYLTSFVVAADGTVTAGPGGVYFDGLATPLAQLPSPTPITLNQTLNSAITSSQPYQTYSFEGKANDLVTVSMNALSGNLDTLLYLLGPTGDLVDSNDDAFQTTNSEITNARLVTDGTYTIVATRYGQTIGGTEGEYSVSLSGATGELPEDLQSLNLPTGDIEVSLVWNSGADLQLLVRDFQGNSIFDDTPTSPSGGRLVAFGNRNCTPSQTTTRPVSYIYWPSGSLRPGSYEYEVWYQNQCNDPTPVEFTLNIAVRGQLVISERVQPQPDERYVGNFRIGVDGTVTVGESGIVGGSDTLNYQSQIGSAIPIVSGQTVNGTLRTDKPFDLYSFEGRAGDVVTIGMQKGAGATLDTKLFLIGPNGFEVATNDDQVPGENTDSLINQVTLSQDGTYIIIATRYGMQYGGTEGAYSLTMRQN